MEDQMNTEDKRAKFKLRGKLDNWDPNIVFHGQTLKSFYRPARGKKKKVDCWVKILIFIASFYFDKRMSKEGKDFFVSTKGIYNALTAYGNTYSLRWVQMEVKFLIDYGFIKEEKYPATSEELKANPKNKHLRRRKLIPDMDVIKEFLSVFDEEDPILSALPDRDRLKKLIYKRPYSYCEKIEDKFDLYTENGSRRKLYKNVNEMFSCWVIRHSSRYYDVSKLIKNYIPVGLVNEQERVDEAFVSKASDKGVITTSQIEYFQEFIEVISEEEMKSYVGWKVPNLLKKYIAALGFKYNRSGFIISWNRLNHLKSDGTPKPQESPPNEPPENIQSRSGENDKEKKERQSKALEAFWNKMK